MILRKNKKYPIFVIGSGRSGTHLLGRTFESSKEVKVFIEDPKFFRPITNLATGKVKDSKQLKKVIKLYKKEFNKVSEKFILEKTHPNIWFVEQLAEAFPNSKFIGIKRSVFATVSSMLNHKGVLNWYNVLPQDINNPFLGITDDNRNYFAQLPLESKCAIRWKAHVERLDQLENSFPDKVLVIDYEEFYSDNKSLMSKIEQFTGLSSTLYSEILNDNGLKKWKTFLSDEQIENINSVV